MGKLLLLSGVLAVLFSACTFKPSGISSADSETNASDGCQTVQHASGETRVCGQPQRIVVLNPKMLDILLSLGVQPVGYAEVFSNRQGDFDQPSQQIPYLGDRVTQPIANLGISGEPSLEAIARLSPDLIIGDSRENREEYSQLSQIAPTLLFEYVGADKWQKPLQTIADALGRTDKAQTVIETYQQQLEATRQKVASIVESYPTVLMVSSEQLNQTIDLVTPLEFCGGLVEELGFQLVALPNSEPEGITQPISLEILPQLDADLVIVLGHDMTALSQIETTEDFEAEQLETIRRSWQSSTLAQSLKASQAGRIYFIPTYICLGLPAPIGAQLTLERLQEQLLPLTAGQAAN